jgi:trk system potassium uptake protein TrkH
MLAQISKLPFFVVLMGLGALLMIVPAAHGAILDDFNTMRIFFYGMILFGILTLLVGLATAGYSPPSVVRSQLVTLAASFTLLPVMFAIPFYEAVQNTSFLEAWFEMVSCFTTTGATLYDTAGRLTPSLHLWRALVAWLGGLMIWVTALAILAPMNLGGFEVRAVGRIGTGVSAGPAMAGEKAASAERLARYAYDLFPIYAGLTLILWIILMALGDVPDVALVHAMATISTSGITSVNGLSNTLSGFWGELAVFVFFAFAISRLTFSRQLRRDTDSRTLLTDPEVLVAAVLIGGVTLLLLGFLFGARSLRSRHF